jgi:hypothetical protein
MFDATLFSFITNHSIVNDEMAQIIFWNGRTVEVIKN